MKLEEMREKTVEELKAAVVDSKKQLFDLRVQKSLNKLENTAQIGKIKREIAQMKTVINEKAE
ncbi:MAG: 50S ribosomal protein L29 [Candidatus Gastranaerophilaceae bacterium]|jgi:large subunit ribosomal protein L29